MWSLVKWFNPTRTPLCYSLLASESHLVTVTSMNFTRLFLEVAALVVFHKLVFPLLRILIVYTIGKKFSKRHLLKTAGEWAIVTGSTDGIGKAFARELAKEGLNIMLISRDISKLNLVAREIQLTFNVQTKVVACDFTEADVYEMLEREISDLSSLSCLVNNVGMSYPYCATYADAEFMDAEFIRRLINCNMTSMACLTRICLPIMTKQRTTGSAIINLSSTAGLSAAPYLALYGASKGFVGMLSLALSYELRDSNVYHQVFCPMFVTTAMSGIKRPSFFVPTPEQYAASALDILGVEPVSMGYWRHALQYVPLTLHPTIANFMMKANYERITRLRKR